MIDCIAEARYSETKPQRVDVSPSRKRYVQTTFRSYPVSDLVQQWHREVGSRSSTSDIRDLPSSKAIVAFGSAALPAIIADLHRQPSWLFLLARDIAGEDPVSDNSRGNVPAMSEAWVSWFLSKKS